jgi:uncharacterized membrane protein YkvA (DUF1232 family)
MEISRWKKGVRQLKDELGVIYLAYRHPRTPWYAKAIGAVIVGYALSPIDLIPDFIPVLGYLDDIVIIAAGAFLLSKVIPQEILEECRREAASRSPEDIPRFRAAGALIVLIWLLIIYAIFKLIETAIDILQSRGTAVF